MKVLLKGKNHNTKTYFLGMTSGWYCLGHTQLIWSSILILIFIPILYLGCNVCVCLTHVNMNKTSNSKTLYKNQGWEPIYQKYKANESMSRRNPKEKKWKLTINKREKEENPANITQGCKTTVNDHKENLRWKSCCLPQIN
jgi:hypothetical protein